MKQEIEQMKSKAMWRIQSMSKQIEENHLASTMTVATLEDDKTIGSSSISREGIVLSSSVSL